MATAWRVVAVLGLGLAVVVTTRGPQGAIAGDARVYVEAAQSIGEGSYESASEPDGVPRYPPGFPLVLAPAVAVWDDAGAEAVATGIGILLVVLVWLAAGALGGPRAAALAAVLWSLSPLANDYATDVMSDPTGAVLVLGAFLAARSQRWTWVAIALAASTWMRLIHAAFLLGMGRRRWAWLVAGAVLVPLAAFQLVTYGRLAGYDGGEAQFSLSNVFGGTPLLFMGRPSPWPNWQFFPGLLWGLKGGLVPLLPIFAAWELIERRNEPSARLAAWVIVANVAVYLPYFFQASRFVLPAASLVIVFSAAGLVRVVDVVRPTPVDQERSVSSGRS